MTMLNNEQQQQVAKAIASVESKTDAELVAVLAKQSDKYTYIPLLWASLLALLAPLVSMLSPLWLETGDIFLAQLIVFLLAAMLFSIPLISIRLIPKSVRYYRASNMARRQFLENNLHHTKNETGVLLFVSEAERYVEIVADRGINEKVDENAWQNIVDQFVSAVKNKQVLQGYLDAIDACEAILSEHFPATEAKNELPNKLVILD